MLECQITIGSYWKTLLNCLPVCVLKLTNWTLRCGRKDAERYWHGHTAIEIERSSFSQISQTLWQVSCNFVCPDLIGHAILQLDRAFHKYGLITRQVCHPFFFFLFLNTAKSMCLLSYIATYFFYSAAKEKWGEQEAWWVHNRRKEEY